MENEPIDKRFSFEVDSVYGGSMTPYEWYQAEMEVEESIEFDNEPVPYTTLRADGNEVVAHWYNTEIVEYGKDWEHMSHLKVDATDQNIGTHVYFFRNTHTSEGEEERWSEIYDALMEQNYALRKLPQKPSSIIFAQYYMGIRGGEPIEDIIGRLLVNGEE